MKQLKFFTLALTLFIGVTMTSCLDSENDPTMQMYVVAKVQSSGLYGTTFVTPEGQRITPTTESVLNYTANSQISMSAISGQVVQMFYSWNSDMLDIDPVNDQDISGVDLIGIVSLKNPTLVVQGANVGVVGRDSVATHAITSLTPKISDSYKYQPYFFDDMRNIIILPVSYLLSSQGLNGTSCTLVYYPDDAETQADKANGILRLHLNYRVTNGLTPSVNYPSMSIANYYGLNFFFKAYNLSDYTSGQSILQAWGSSTVPEHINIVVSENANSAELNGSKQGVYPVVTYDEYQTGLGM